MALTELTRVCICHALISDPAAAACERCSRILVPHHSTWPLFTKWYGLSELGRRRFHSWLTEQEAWEWILKDAMVCGAGIGPNPRGVQFTTTTPVAELYPRFLQLARDWKAAGSPIAHAIDLTKRVA